MHKLKCLMFVQFNIDLKKQNKALIKANDFKLNKNVDHFDLSAIVSFLVAFGFALFVMDIVLLVRIQSNYSLFIPYFVIWPIAMVYAIYFAYRYPELFEFEKKKKKKNTEAEAVQPPNIN